MSAGELSGIVDGAIVGWIAAGADRAVPLDVSSPGEPGFSALASGPAEDGRIAFAISSGRTCARWALSMEQPVGEWPIGFHGSSRSER